ncbi:MAG: hypothetical protein JW783_08085 [Bacteroidales bacterium]|nr:hypothetical protein [Bacteroidales bacterium]MBN2749899.1 hypothetical protein [Bacteroidales bacterium]
MANITSTTELKNAIVALETEQRAKGVELKEQFSVAYKSVDPIDLIKETIKGGIISPGVIENIIVGGVGLASGYLTRKIFVGSSANLIKKLLGSALQLGATALVTQNAQTIKYVGQLLFNLYSSRKKSSTRK